MVSTICDLCTAVSQCLYVAYMYGVIQSTLFLVHSPLMRNIGFLSEMKKNYDCEVAWQGIDMGLNASVPTPICIWTSSSVKSTLSTLIFTHDCDIHSVLTPIMLCHMLLLLCAVK